MLPAVNLPLDIEADVAGLDDDPRIMRSVRGQVAVASTVGQVRRVRIIPEKPQANPETIAALRDADLITLGPGSWFSSVLPHVLVPEIVNAITSSDALRVVVLNLSAEPGETQGFSAERHLHVLAQHAPNLRVDKVIVDGSGLPNESERVFVQRAASVLGATAVFRDVCQSDENGHSLNKHCPDKLAQVLTELYTDYAAQRDSSAGAPGTHRG